MNETIKKYKLSRNPFPPAASGIDVGGKELYIPEAWKNKVKEYYETLSRGGGVKAFPVIGEYGSGKTVLLKGYLKDFFEEKRIKAFYFENPGTQFYDLADTLMRELGRYEFSKALWELCKEYTYVGGQRRLFPLKFSKMLSSLKTKRNRENMARELAHVLKKDLILTDEAEIAYKLALMIVETASKPYFDYRDFVASRTTSLVAERQEPKYFKALINAVLKVYNVQGVAFLIDEFEGVAISKRMSSRIKRYEYLATLRHLIDFSEKENLWIVMAMTPEAATASEDLDPALWKRFTHDKRNTLILDPFSKEESKKLLIWWLDRARESQNLKKYKGKLFPFPEEFLDLLESRPNLLFPRKLVKIGFFILAKADEEEIEVPIPIKFIEEIVNEFYPEENGVSEDDSK